MKRVVASWGCIMLMAAAPPAIGATLAQQSAALREIRATAADICQTPPIDQQSRSVKLTTAADAKLAGVVKRVATIGVAGSVDYRKEYSSGVLQKDLAASIRSGNDCKLSVFSTLQPKMVPVLSPPAPPSSIKRSPAAAVPPVSRFNKPIGYFQKQGRFWLEYPELAPGQNFRFIESGRDADYVYLSDLSRAKPEDPGNAMLVRLPFKGGPAQWSWQNPLFWIDFTVVFPVRG